ncbi:MAG: ATP-binding cassette domain-containing protein [Rhizobacter sp.]|nr:ATP-binding cassette domain-containing protein [Rhizobacter sp.]
MSSQPLLQVQGLVKRYQRGWPQRQTTFCLEADFQIDGPAIVGVMGANGAGKTTMFELITGSNLPTDGRVLVAGQDIHRVRYRERDRLALHYHQSYQVRSFTRTHPAFMLEHAASERAQVHLFDEPQFNTQDGYIGFMLDFFRRLRAEGRLVFLCLHPNEPVHLDIFNEVCDRYLFVHKDESRVSRVMQAGSLHQLARDARVRHYLGKLAPLADKAA